MNLTSDKFQIEYGKQTWLSKLVQIFYPEINQTFTWKPVYYGKGKLTLYSKENAITTIENLKKINRDNDRNNWFIIYYDD